MSHIVHKSNFIALQKANESYLFFYQDEDAEGVVRAMARFAANPDLSFTWHDAAMLSRDVAITIGLAPSDNPGASPDVESRI